MANNLVRYLLLDIHRAGDSVRVEGLRPWCILRNAALLPWFFIFHVGSCRGQVGSMAKKKMLDMVTSNLIILTKISNITKRNLNTDASSSFTPGI